MAKQRIDDLFMLLTQYNQERLELVAQQLYQDQLSGHWECVTRELYSITEEDAQSEATYFTAVEDLQMEGTTQPRHFDSESGRESGPVILEKPWVEVIDHYTGAHYYWHAITGTVTYEVPLTNTICHRMGGPRYKDDPLLSRHNYRASDAHIHRSRTRNAAEPWVVLPQSHSSSSLRQIQWEFKNDGTYQPNENDQGQEVPGTRYDR